MTKILTAVLHVMIVVFMLLGAVLVAAQLLGAVTLQGTLIAGAVDWLGRPAYLIAALARLLAFALEYPRTRGRAVE